MQLKIEYVDIDSITPYVNNSRTHPQEQVNQIKASIKEFGMCNPILTHDGTIVAGHGRYLALQQLEYKQIPIIKLDHLTDAQRKAYVIADNKIALNSEWDEEMLSIELEDIYKNGIDLDLTGFDDLEIDEMDLDLGGFDEIEGNILDEEKVDEVHEISEKPCIKRGDLIELGHDYQHRVLCGDSTSEDDVFKLMNGVKADMVFTDPPYGMKKDDIENDSLNFKDLLNFNKKWIPLTFKFLKDNGSWYCWGIDEPLMDIYSEILKPMISKQEVVFRNLITWDKGHGQGQNSDNTRSYTIADEKCLFVMCGVQGFNNNADNYYEKFEPTRLYLREEIKKIGTMAKVGEIAGVSSRMIGHYVSKSQWDFPTEKTYNKLRNYCIEKDIQAFKKEYEEIKKEYEEIKKEYEEIKKEYYSTRAYFNNTHDNFNNVWHFDRHIRTGEEGGHSTPKPIPLCERAIMSSSKKEDVIVDVFLGSGSTLIASENLSRKCYGMEITEKYAQVIIQRYVDYTSNPKIKINGEDVNWYEYRENNK